MVHPTSHSVGTAVLQGLKRLGLAFNYSPLSSAHVNNVWSCTSASPLYHRGLHVVTLFSLHFFYPYFFILRVFLSPLASPDGLQTYSQDRRLRHFRSQHRPLSSTVSWCKCRLYIELSEAGNVSFLGHVTTVIRHLTTGRLSEKCVVRQFRRCANII